MGIKPLVYAWRSDRLIFASEVKALRASGLVDPEIDPASMRLLLTYGSIYQPNTIFKGVKMLLPAHRLIVEGNRERLERYWSLGVDRCEGLRPRPYEEQVEEIRAVLEESVRLQMISDVPLGAFLSGGVDSSLLVALMARQVGEKRVKTFSVGFESEGSDIDESIDAERTANFIGSDHTRVVVTGDDVLARIKHIACALDQPSVDGVNSYFISMVARRAVTVAISGTGGDELFAGYPWFGRLASGEAQWRDQPAWKSFARAAVAPAVHSHFFDAGSIRRVEQLRFTTDFRTRYASAYKIFGPNNATHVLSEDLRAAARIGQSAYHDLECSDELAGHSTLERVTGACLRGYTNNQLLRDIDAVSMSHSLEVRVPYLDPIVANAALSLPDEAKSTPSKTFRSSEDYSYRELGTKRIILDIAKPLLPPGYDMRPKRGFAMPFDHWLRGPLRAVIADTLSAEAVRRRGWLDVAPVEAVRNDFFAGRLNWPLPWLLMILELWAREIVDQSPGSNSCAQNPSMMNAEIASAVLT